MPSRLILGQGVVYPPPYPQHTRYRERPRQNQILTLSEHIPVRDEFASQLVEPDRSGFVGAAK